MSQLDWPQMIIFMQTEVLGGSIFISTPEGRLLDELNGRSVMGPENRDKFLDVTNVTIWHGDGTEEKVSVVHVKKSSIQMAATSSDSSRGIGGKPDPKPYPFTEKVSLRVKMQMPGYEGTGSLHRVNHQQVEHVLAERSAFIPITHGEVCSLASGKRWYLPFLAVNKELILSLHEVFAASP